MNTQCTFWRRWPARVLLSMVALSALFTWGKQSAPGAADKNSDLKTFMRMKLGASSEILEGLAMEDASLIRKGAKELLEMSKAEQWNVLLDEDYRDFNRDFRSEVRKLEKAAEEGNFDNALLQWIDATKSCIECHKYVRDQRPVLKK